jgi:hypothetical protein
MFLYFILDEIVIVQEKQPVHLIIYLLDNTLSLDTAAIDIDEPLARITSSVHSDCWAFLMIVGEILAQKAWYS